MEPGARLSPNATGSGTWCGAWCCGGLSGRVCDGFCEVVLSSEPARNKGANQTQIFLYCVYGYRGQGTPQGRASVF